MAPINYERSLAGLREVLGDYRPADSGSNHCDIGAQRPLQRRAEDPREGMGTPYGVAVAQVAIARYGDESVEPVPVNAGLMARPSCCVGTGTDPKWPSAVARYWRSRKPSCPADSCRSHIQSRRLPGRRTD